MTTKSIPTQVRQSAYKAAFNSYPFIALNHAIVGIVCYILSQVVFDSSIRALVWLSILLITLACRYGYIRHLHSNLSSIVHCDKTYWIYAITSGALGVVWSAGSILAMNTGYPNIELPITLIASGLAFGGVIYHINFRGAFHCYFWSLMGPIAVYLIWVKGFTLAGATIIATGIVYLCFYIAKLHKRSLQWLLEDAERERLITDLSSANERIQKMSETDALTGLNNRTYFNNTIPNIWQTALENRQSLSVVLIDIDFFKPYNDNYGHVAGDEGLKQVAQTIKSVTPPTAETMVARVGGEEFIAVIPQDNPESNNVESVNPESVAKYAEALREAVEAMKLPHDFSGCSQWITISLGIATAKPNKDSKPIELIDRADQALYKAKSRGRNNVVTEVDEISSNL